MKVSINHAGAKGGQITISYKDLDQLDKLCQILGS